MRNTAKKKILTAHAMKAYGGSSSTYPLVLNLGIVRRQVVKLMGRTFYLRPKSPTHWVGRTVGLGVWEKTRIPCFQQDSNPEPSSPQFSRYRSNDLSSSDISHA